MIDVQEITNMLKTEIKSRVDAEFDNANVINLMSQQFLSASDEKIGATVNNMLNNMIRDGKLMDLVESNLRKGLQEKLDEEVARRASSLLSSMDIGSLINSKLNEFMDTRIRTFKLPNASIPLEALDLTNLTLPANKISPGVFKNFTSSGIEDIANDVQLTVMNDMVIVENKLIAKDISVADRATINNLDVEELRVSKKIVIHDSSFSQGIQTLINDAIARDKENSRIDIGGDSIYSNGNSILNGSALGPGVVTSNLRKVGRLQDLSIVNDLSVGETLVARNNKVGINTEEPAGALTVWDEEAEFTVRKHSSRTTYVGTTRDCDLVIGANGKVVATFRKDGTIGTNKLEIGTVKISVSDQQPQYEGTPGELVIISRAVADQPWAYQCIEGQKWAALKR